MSSSVLPCTPDPQSLEANEPEDSSYSLQLLNYASQMNRGRKRGRGAAAESQAKLREEAIEGRLREGLAKPVPKTNIGFRLLASMGYRPGMGLGKDESGRIEPLEIDIRKTRAGVGAPRPKSPTVSASRLLAEDALLTPAQREKRFQEEAKRYRERMREKFEEKRREILGLEADADTPPTNAARDVASRPSTGDRTTKAVPNDTTAARPQVTAESSATAATVTAAAAATTVDSVSDKPSSPRQMDVADVAPLLPPATPTTAAQADTARPAADEATAVSAKEARARQRREAWARMRDQSGLQGVPGAGAAPPAPAHEGIGPPIAAVASPQAPGQPSTDISVGGGAADAASSGGSTHQVVASCFSAASSSSQGALLLGQLSTPGTAPPPPPLPPPPSDPVALMLYHAELLRRRDTQAAGTSCAAPVEAVPAPRWGDRRYGSEREGRGAEGAERRRWHGGRRGGRGGGSRWHGRDGRGRSHDDENAGSATARRDGASGGGFAQWTVHTRVQFDGLGGVTGDGEGSGRGGRNKEATDADTPRRTDLDFLDF